MPSCSSICVRLVLPVLLAVCAYTYLAIQNAVVQVEAWNDREWHIEGLPKAHIAVQCFNALCGSICVSALLTAVEVTVIQPSLRASLSEMEKAEGTGAVPPRLCGPEARQKMAQRLDAFAADLRASSSLTNFAKVTLYAAAQRNLEAHRALLALAPAAKNEKVVAPVFIVSIPRTCTTILHRTMAQDRKRWRNFDLCDMARPIPPVPRDDVYGRELCALEVSIKFAIADTLYPGWIKALESMHVVHPGEADEDLGWYDNGLGHLYMDIIMLTYPEQRAKPGGMSPLESTEVAEYRFAFLDLVMRIYQSIEERVVEGAPRPWLMKDPSHAAYLPQLLAQFPDAKLIFSHRPPKEIVTSMAKLFVVYSSTQHIPGAPGTTAEEWGRETIRRMDGYVQGLINFTHNQPNGSELAMGTSTRRVDLKFHALVQDVPAAIAKIYGQLYPDSPAPTTEATESFAAYLQKYARHKTGMQSRSMDDFRLNEKDVAHWEEYESLFLS